MDFIIPQNLPPLIVGVLIIAQIFSSFLMYAMKQNHQREIKRIDHQREQDQREAGHITSLIDLMDKTNQQRTEDAIRMDASMNRLADVIEDMAVIQATRDEQLNDTMRHLATSLGAIETTLTSNTAVVSDMKGAFASLETNVIAKLQNIAQLIGTLTAESGTGNQQHKDILKTLDEVKTAVLKLVPPPKPKPPNVTPLPQTADDEKSKETDKEEKQAS